MKLSAPVRFCVGMLLTVSLLEGALYVGVPALMREMVPGLARAELGRTVRIGDVSFNPLTLVLKVRDIRMASADGSANDVTLAALEVDVSSVSLRKAAPVIERLSVDGLQVSLARDAQGRLSIEDILEKLAETPPSPEPARYALNNVRVRNSAFSWKDEVSAQTLAVRDIELDLPFLSTLPSDVKIEVQPQLRAQVESGELQLQVKALPFDEQQVARLSVSLEKFPLTLTQPWLPKSAGVVVSAGELQTKLDFEFSQNAPEQRFLSVSGTTGLAGFKSRVKHVTGAVDVPSAQLELDKLVLLAPQGSAPALGKVKLVADVVSYGHIQVQGEASLAPLVWKGTAAIDALPLVSLVPWLPASPVSVLGGKAAATATVQCAAPASGSSALSCDVPLASLSVKGLSVSENSGAGGAAPVVWQFPSVRATAKDIRPASATPFSFTLDVALPDAANALHADGEVVLQPLSVQSALRLTSVPLKLVQPYLAAFTTAQVTRGTLDLDTRVSWQDEVLRVAGTAGVAAFRLAPSATERSVLKFEQFNIKGLDAQANGAGLQRLNISGVKVAGLDARVERDSAGRLNWEQLLAPKQSADSSASGTNNGKALATEAKPVAANTKNAAASPVIEVGVIQLERTNVLFSDAGVQPGFTAQLTNLKGQMSAFSTLGPRRSTVELTGSLDGDGQLVVSGQFDPVSPRDYLNISLRARGIEMTRLSPYSARYAGYNIAKGKLSTTLNYRIENGELVADNALFLDQLNFGDAVASPDATTLPVRLAVALLKNLKGEIDLNLPVKGSLTDPQFSIGEVVFKALGNIIVKAVSAPFRLVASLFDSDEEFAGSLEFEAGVSQVPPSAQKQLNGLVAMLVQKPDLELEVTGYADLLTDSAGLQQVRKRADAVNAEDIRRLAYERAVAAKNAIVGVKPELADRIFLVAPTREQLGKQAEKPRRAVDFAVR